MEHQLGELSNGIRLVFTASESTVAHCGLFIDTGSRDELPHEHGMAHFIEHTLFKGTQKRKAYHILSRLDDVGGELNAYTTKEETVVHASFLSEYFSRAVELIADIVFHSTFPQREIDKEKEVIVDEILSYKDNPSEQIFDDFEENCFPNQPIGRQILGTEDAIRQFTTSNVLTFIANNYHTENMVFSVVGKFRWKDVYRLTETYLGKTQALSRSSRNRVKPQTNIFTNYVPMDLHQAHCLIGSEAYPMRHDNSLGLNLLANLLAGNGMNARLSLSLREKHGIAYLIESGYQAYTDTGLFHIYFGTDRENLEKGIRLVRRELQTLCNKPLGPMQLEKAKRQYIGQIAMAVDSNENLMMSNGKSLMYFSRIESLDEVYQKINALSASDLMQIANETFSEQQLSTLVLY